MRASERRMRASERPDMLAGRKWLLAIGQGLRAEYVAVEEPVPEPLAALFKQLGRNEPGQEPT
jgi:hypothetical protein